MLGKNASMISRQCRICRGSFSRQIRAREMMFGTRKKFDYLQCSECGCLQIAKIPSDMSDYYPSEYYSFSLVKKRKRWIRDILRKHRSLYIIEQKGLLGAMLSRSYKPDPRLKAYGRIGVKRTDTILDVGSGGGLHVRHMRELGFKSALAIDPFIDKDIYDNGALLAQKSSIFDINDKFSLITFHHSFEHMDKQQEVLEKAGTLLDPDGRILIRVPSVTSDAFDIYGADWADLDAPRHFYLHSHKSIKLLADFCRLKVKDLWCDSEAFQFWASEQYTKDIPLNDPFSYSNNANKSIFSSSRISEFHAKSLDLNKRLRGDSICVLLSLQ